MSRLAEINPLWFFAGWCMLVAVICVWFYARGKLTQGQTVVADDEDWMWPERIDDQRRD